MHSKLGALAITLAATVVFPPASARAACDVDFDNAPAKGLSAWMVRSFQPCPGSPYPSFPNSETEGNVPACQPVFPREYLGASTPYRYAAAGRCQVKVSSKLARDCAEIDGSDGEPLGLPSGPCHVSRVQAKCKGIIDEESFFIGQEDAGWTLRMIVRASIDDETNGAMTVIDLPVSFDFQTPNRGEMKLDALSAEPLQALGVFLPECTVLQITRMFIHDPLGYRFAAMGGSTVPASAP
jgi:hypothetical protein